VIGAGTVFELSPAEDGWHETVLYSFCGAQNCADGAVPISALTLDGAGHLFGTTIAGGSANVGVAFELEP